MKKILMLLMLNVCFFVKTELRELSEKDFNQLEKELIGTSSSNSKDAPYLLSEFFEGHELYACYEDYDRYFAFDNKEEADAIQIGCYNGKGLIVRWYIKKEKKLCIIL